MRTEHGFVIGNGISRLDLKLKKLRKKGKTYGCNWLYEEFQPDVLVAVDTAMAQHIQKSEYSKNHTFYTREPSKNSGAHKITKNHAFSSGPVALTLACQDRIPYIYLIGFDLMGEGKKNIDAKKRKFNNVYAGRQFYKSPGTPETHFGNWITQVRDIMREFSTRKFFRVHPHMDYHPPEWLDMPNYRSLTLKEFWDQINN